MKRSAYGRDFGLSTRMFLTMFFLGIVYIASSSFSFSSSDVVPLHRRDHGRARVLPVLHLGQDRLMASGAKVVGPDEAPELHGDGRASRGDGRPSEAARRRYPDRHAERVCDRPEPEALRRRSHGRPLEPPRAAGGRGRSRPRAHAHREPRRGRHDDRKLLLDARCHAGALRPVGRDVQRRRPRPGLGRSRLADHVRRLDRHLRDQLCADHDDLALPGVRGRPWRGADHRCAGEPDERAPEDRRAGSPRSRSGTSARWRA